MKDNNISVFVFALGLLFWLCAIWISAFSGKLFLTGLMLIIISILSYKKEEA